MPIAIRHPQSKVTTLPIFKKPIGISGIFKKTTPINSPAIFKK
jgi:hypothetical protein